MNLKFLSVVAALTGICIFGLFCFTVRTFPEGGVRIEGPWGVRIEASLGGKSIQTLPSQQKREKPRQTEKQVP